MPLVWPIMVEEISIQEEAPDDSLYRFFGAHLAFDR
jgi:hypothetical protein